MKRNSLPGALILGALALATTLVAPTASAQQTGYSFVPLTPCRLIDTRGPNATNGGPVMSAGAIRAFQVKGQCGVPAAAKAVALSVTSVAPTVDGFFALWPSGNSYPGHSNLNFVANQPPIANFAIIALAATTLDLSIVLGTAVPGTAHVVVDVMGYYQ